MISRKAWRWVVVGSALIATAGCGAKTDVRTRSGPTTFTGTWAHFRFLPGTPVSSLSVIVMEAGDGCGSAPGPSGARTYLQIDLWSSALEPNSPGHFAIDRTAPGSAFATYGHAEGNEITFRYGMSGTLEVSNLSESVARGSVDVTLDDGTRIEGDFSASTCPPPPG